jgi:hypothetical protein
MVSHSRKYHLINRNRFGATVEDVRKRRRTIATGDGEVYGARYATRDWGISEFAF